MNYDRMMEEFEKIEEGKMVERLKKAPPNFGLVPTDNPRAWKIWPIAERVDEYTCQYCGKECKYTQDMAYDHEDFCAKNPKYDSNSRLPVVVQTIFTDIWERDCPLCKFHMVKENGHKEDNITCSQCGHFVWKGR